jgi:hypothetical protein
MTHGIKLLSRLGFLLLLLGAASGCHTLGPKMPKVLGAPAVVSYSTDSFKNDVNEYRGYIDNSIKDTGPTRDQDLVKARAKRDEIAYRVMAEIELDYGRFEMTLTTNRALFQTGSDIVQLGLAAAIAVTPAGDVTDILAASLAGFKGTTLSIDKNFFEQKTTEALISQMRANRKTIQAQLLKSLATRDVTVYPLESVWVDLVDFYYAGTVPSALVSMASNAGSEATAAKKNLEDTVKGLPATTHAQALQAIDVRDEMDKLETDAASTDPKVSQPAITSLRAILVAIGKPVAANISVDDLVNECDAAMAEANGDPEKKKAMTAAVLAAKSK